MGHVHCIEHIIFSTFTHYFWAEKETLELPITVGITSKFLLIANLKNYLDRAVIYVFCDSSELGGGLRNLKNLAKILFIYFWPQAVEVLFRISATIASGLSLP